MIEERDKIDLVSDFLSGSPNIILLLEEDGVTTCMEGKGKDLLLMWATLTLDLLKQLNMRDPADLMRVAALANNAKLHGWEE